MYDICPNCQALDPNFRMLMMVGGRIICPHRAYPNKQRDQPAAERDNGFEVGQLRRELADARGELAKWQDAANVAFSVEQTFELAEAVLSQADVPCVLSEDRRGEERLDPDVRLVIPRPFFWIAERTPAFRERPVVLVDRSAVFERAHCLPPKYRTVEGF